MDAPAPVIYKKRSFLSTLALGLSCLAISIVLSGAAVILYGMNIADRKSDGLFDAAGGLVRGLPELRKSLPPALADLLDDRRRPDYLRNIEVAVKDAEPGPGERWAGAAIEVRNRGPEVVSLLALRIVALDGKGSVVSEWTEWAATPFATDGDWRGPILPGSTRHLAARPCPARGRPAGRDLHVEVEVSDIRVWGGPAAAGKERQV